jgi:hypothetical protein
VDVSAGVDGSLSEMEAKPKSFKFLSLKLR